jgi:hypothetical protein
MIRTYNDTITLNHSRTVYNIKEEGPGDWKSFIANEQFNQLLEKTIKSVFNNDADNHKPIWIAGTYGTGKSHAGAVIQHLMCDAVEDITDYIHLEYEDPKYEILRSDLLQLREHKRLFPVNLYGQQNITHINDLSLQLQREIKGALIKANVDVVVKTDFDSYVSHIEENTELWEMIIRNNPKLASAAPNIEKLVSSLKACDTAVLGRVNDALRETRLEVRLSSENLPRWIIEIQNKLREKGVADGLLIVWDEFTAVCTSPIGVKLLEEIQEVSEVMMSPENDSYFMFISHPSAFNLLSEEKRTQTMGRYHYITYNMEQVSAFKIMSRKFNIVDAQAHNALVNEFYDTHAELLDIFSASSNQPEETQQDLKKLFPLHPSTANLATYYAREAGSSSRSVFEFLACDAVRAFFNDESAYQNFSTITPDYLWDYVLDAFIEDTTKFGAVIERFNSFGSILAHQGVEYLAVFKGILLLNALNNIANTETVTPSEANIRNLYRGTDYEPELTHILNYLNEKSIIPRMPGDMFMVQFTALPTDQLEKIKNELVCSEFKLTEKVVNFSDIALMEFNKSWTNIARPFKLEFLSQQANEYTLINKMENLKRTVKGYEIFIVALVARNYDELNTLKAIMYNNASNPKLQNTVVVIFDATLEQQNYDRFIEFVANAKCASNHGLTAQQDTYTSNAKAIIRQWVSHLKAGNLTYYINGNDDTCAGSRFISIINNTIAPIIFTNGPESLPLIQAKFSKTYWKKAAVKSTVDAMLQFNTKEEVINKVGGQAKHVELLLQDSVDSNLKMKSDINPQHPLKLVCDFVDKQFRKTDKNQEFNLADKLEDLSRPPYGLFQSYAGMAMVAYAMRKYVKQIFDTNGKPRESRNIVDDVCDMFNVWETGKKNNRLNMMFESKESSDLCKAMISIFRLNELPKYKDVSSLTDARWALLEFAKMKGYPIWSLKYVTEDEALNKLVDNITKICDPNGMANQVMINETSRLIRDNDIEIRILLKDDVNFKSGFENYLKEDTSVKVKDEELDLLYDYLLKHLQGDIGRWSEQEVRLQEKNWRIDMNAENEANDIPDDDSDGNDEAAENKDEFSKWGKTGPDNATLRQNILNKVEMMSRDDLKTLVTNLCNNAPETILNTINNYVSRI